MYSEMFVPSDVSFERITVARFAGLDMKLGFSTRIWTNIGILRAPLVWAASGLKFLA